MLGRKIKKERGVGREAYNLNYMVREGLTEKMQ